MRALGVLGGQQVVAGHFVYGSDDVLQKQQLSRYLS